MAASKEVRSTQLASKTIFQEKTVTKSESRQIHHYPQKFTWKWQILAIFGNPQNIIPLKIPCLTVNYPSTTCSEMVAPLQRFREQLS